MGLSSFPILSSTTFRGPFRQRFQITEYIIFLKRQVFQVTKRQLVAPLKQVIDRLLTKSQNTRWQRTALDVSPSQLWCHGHAVTEYQLWTRYRHATGQLNFWYPDRPLDGFCPYPECGHKETQEHCFWECPRAQASWARLISH